MALPAAKMRWYLQSFLIPMPICLFFCYAYFYHKITIACWFSQGAALGLFFMLVNFIWFFYPRSVSKTPIAAAKKNKLIISCILLQILLPFLLLSVTLFLTDVAFPTQHVLSASDITPLWHTLFSWQPWGLIALLSILIISVESEDKLTRIDQLLLPLSHYFVLPQLQILVDYYHQTVMRILNSVIVICCLMLLNCVYHYFTGYTGMLGFYPATLVIAAVLVLPFNHQQHEYWLTWLSKLRVSVGIIVSAWLGIMALIYFGLSSLLLFLYHLPNLRQVLPSLPTMITPIDDLSSVRILFFWSLWMSTAYTIAIFYAEQFKSQSTRFVIGVIGIFPALFFYLLNNWASSKVMYFFTQTSVIVVGTLLAVILMMGYFFSSRDTAVFLEGYIPARLQKKYWKPLLGVRLSGVFAALLASLYILSGLQWFMILAFVCAVQIALVLLLAVCSGLRQWCVL